MKRMLLAILLIVSLLLTGCGYIVVEDPDELTIGSIFLPRANAEAEPEIENAIIASDLDAEMQSAIKEPLARGARGEDVKALQEMLREYGFLKGKADGIFGVNTEKAVKEVQTYKNNAEEKEAEVIRQKFLDMVEKKRERTKSRLDALTISNDIAETGPVQTNDILFKGITADIDREFEKTPFTADGIVTGEFMSYLMDEFGVYAQDLTRGSRGSDVKRLQTRLNSMYYLNGGIDGQFGLNTYLAVKYFQRLNGLEETGIADEETQNVLFSEKCKLSDYPMYKYKVEISISKQRVYVYEWNFGSYSKLVKTMKCTTGAVETPTPLGSYKMGGPCGRWYYFQKYDCWAQYAYRIVGGILFHSVLYSEKDEATLRHGSVAALGTRASHGCVRLTVEDAKWLYSNIPAGTTCRIYN